MSEDPAVGRLRQELRGEIPLGQTAAEDAVLRVAIAAEVRDLHAKVRELESKVRELESKHESA